MFKRKQGESRNYIGKLQDHIYSIQDELTSTEISGGEIDRGGDRIEARNHRAAPIHCRRVHPARVAGNDTK